MTNTGNLFKQGLDLDGLQTKLNEIYTFHDTRSVNPKTAMSGRDYAELEYILKEVNSYLQLPITDTSQYELETLSQFLLTKAGVYPYKMIQTKDDLKYSSDMMNTIARVLVRHTDFSPQLQQQLISFSSTIQDNTDSVDVHNFLINFEAQDNPYIFNKTLQLFCKNGDLAVFELTDLNLTSSFTSQNKSVLLKLVMDVFQERFAKTEESPAYAEEIEALMSWMCATYMQCKPSDRLSDPDMVAKMMTLGERSRLYYENNEPLFDNIINHVDFIGEYHFGSEYDKLKRVAKALNIDGDYEYWRDAKHGLNQDFKTEVALPEI